MLGYFLCALGFLVNAIALYRLSVQANETQKIIAITDLFGMYPKRISKMETEVRHTLDTAILLERLAHETRAEVLKIQRMLKPSSAEEKS